MIKVLHLESNICHHCIQSCTGCSHFSPICKPYNMTVESLKQDLDNLKSMIHCEYFVLLGGEPLLHPNLLDMIDMVKASGIADRTEVLTNGILLDKQPDAFWEKIGKVCISQYPGVLSSDTLVNITEKAGKFGKVVELLKQNNFQLPFTKSELSPDQAQDNFNRCTYKTVCLTIQDGYFYRCPQSWQIPQQFRGQGYETDGLKIEGLTEKNLNNFLHRPQMLSSCSKCSHNNSIGVKWIPWQQSKRENWLEESGI